MFNPLIRSCKISLSPEGSYQKYPAGALAGIQPVHPVGDCQQFVPCNIFGPLVLRVVALSADKSAVCLFRQMQGGAGDTLMFVHPRLCILLIF